MDASRNSSEVMEEDEEGCESEELNEGEADDDEDKGEEEEKIEEAEGERRCCAVRAARVRAEAGGAERINEGRNKKMKKRDET